MRGPASRCVALLAAAAVVAAGPACTCLAFPDAYLDEYRCDAGRCPPGRTCRTAGGEDVCVAATAATCTTWGGWGSVERVHFEPTNVDDNYRHAPTVSAGGEELMYNVADPINSAEMRRARRLTADPPLFTETALPTLSAPSNENDPELSADGLTLYFASDTTGDFDLWVATRPDVMADFTAPAVKMPVTSLNTISFEAGPSITADDLALYIHSTQLGGTDEEILLATRPSALDPFGKPAAVPGLGHVPGTSDRNPSASSDGLELYFESDRAGGNFEIYVATRTSPTATWMAPAPLPIPVSAPGYEGAPEISADGTRLYFASDRESMITRLFMTTRQCLDP